MVGERDADTLEILEGRTRESRQLLCDQRDPARALIIEDGFTP